MRVIKRTAEMNAMRQILTPDLSGNILIQVPAEWKQQPVEVILLPTDLDLETVMDYIGYNTKLPNGGLLPSDWPIY